MNVTYWIRRPRRLSTANMTGGLEFLSVHPFVRSTAQDKVFGTILGSALGDAIGLYTGKYSFPAFTKFVKIT